MSEVYRRIAPMCTATTPSAGTSARAVPPSTVTVVPVHVPEAAERAPPLTTSQYAPSGRVVATLASAAEANGKPGQWAIKNTRSSAQPVLQNATNRALREKVWKAFVSRGDNGNANDTNATIAEILKLRQQRAELLGFATHANYRMADTMRRPRKTPWA